MTDTFTKTYKVGKNRGHNRVWIEGTMLLSFGFTRGLSFSRTMRDDKMILVQEPEGKHTVAGTEARPIIDLNGKYLDELLYGFTHYDATFNAGCRAYNAFGPAFIMIQGVNQ
tara:strand:- start:287 stop:622 length:336 start_codon:yes stop_codon:yes gene_type:complete